MSRIHRLLPAYSQLCVPSTVSTIFSAAGLRTEGVVRWAQPVPESRSGVYVVSLTDDPSALPASAAEPPLSMEAIEHLLAVRPQLTLDGARPTPHALAERIGSFWFPDEVALYIGRAGVAARPRALRTRIREYYTTPLGARKPHAGGWFLKTLENLPELFVHYAAVADPERAESEMTREYCGSVSKAALAAVRDPDRPFPFANLEWPKGVRKNHGIVGARGELPPP